ncbi:MAG: hemerythrin domain-containing protein [Candidatus Velamenicoccus archaeovorus]
MDAVWGRGPELATLDRQAVRPNVVFASERMKVAVVGLEEGQAIDLHAPEVDMAVAVLEGVGDVWVDEAPRRLRAGDVAVVPAGVTRGVRAASGRLILLHVVSPPPTPEMHELEHRPWPETEERRGGPADAIRAEHRELLPHFDHLATLADEAPSLEPEELRARLDGVLGFLREVLLPHAGAEDEVLYPVVDGLLRATGGATRTMSVDHRAVAGMIERLSELTGREPSAETRRAVQRTLDGLVALIRVHFEKEEEVYVPMLGHLSTDEAAALERALAAVPGHQHHH